jgi:3-ketoacyl-CoA synthase
MVSNLLNLNERESLVQVDVVITSCSCFAPTPSMAAMILNKFKMRSDVATYSLAGMGCSSSIISVDLAKQLLQVWAPVLCSTI